MPTIGPPKVPSTPRPSNSDAQNTAGASAHLTPTQTDLVERIRRVVTAADERSGLPPDPGWPSSPPPPATGRVQGLNTLIPGEHQPRNLSTPILNIAPPEPIKHSRDRDALFDISSIVHLLRPLNSQGRPEPVDVFTSSQPSKSRIQAQRQEINNKEQALKRKELEISRWDVERAKRLNELRTRELALKERERELREARKQTMEKDEELRRREDKLRRQEKQLKSRRASLQTTSTGGWGTGWEDLSPKTGTSLSNGWDTGWGGLPAKTGASSSNGWGEVLPGVNVSLPEINIIKTPRTLTGRQHRFTPIKSGSSKFVVKEDDQTLKVPLMELITLFRNRSFFRKLLSRPKAQLQSLLDRLQSLLDDSRIPYLDFDLRQDIIVAMRRICKNTALFPTAYIIEPIPLDDASHVGAGGFGDIFRVVAGDQTVCVKRLRLHYLRSNQGKKDEVLNVFMCEAILWRQLLHPNVLPFQGSFRQHDVPCLVSPWMEHGNILEYLTGHSQANRYVADITKGLNYLHSWKIVHGDLKGANILVDGSGTARLADFGISSVYDTNIPHWTSQSAVGSRGGSTRWQAPELFDCTDDIEAGNDFGTDMYAWSCVCYEIFTEKLPFYEITREMTVSLKVMQEGLQPSRPPEHSPAWRQRGLTEDFWNLMVRCWAKNPAERPRTREILKFPRLRSVSGRDKRPQVKAFGRPPSRGWIPHVGQIVRILEDVLGSSTSPPPPNHVSQGWFAGSSGFLGDSPASSQNTSHGWGSEAEGGTQVEGYPSLFEPIPEIGGQVSEEEVQFFEEELPRWAQELDQEEQRTSQQKDSTREREQRIRVREEALERRRPTGREHNK